MHLATRSQQIQACDFLRHKRGQRLTLDADQQMLHTMWAASAGIWEQG